MPATSRLSTLKRLVSQTAEASCADNASDSSETPPYSRHLGTRSILDKLRNKSHVDPDEEASTTRSHSTEAPRTPNLAKAFVSSLTATKVSNFFSWFLYYDVVMLPVSPHHWFKAIPSMEMRGWIALGAFLGTGVSYGLDLLGWTAIRDRMQLGKTAEECLIQLGDPEKMGLTQLATVINATKRARKDELQCMKHVQAKLRDLLRLALRLEPVTGTRFSVWHHAVVRRLKEYLAEIVGPKLDELTGSVPVLTARSAEERQQLLYLFEVMQQERQVPLIRYGIFPEPSLSLSLSTSTCGSNETLPFVNQDLLDQDCQIERSYSTTSLKSENQLLRDRNLQLELENRKLIEANEKLAKKIATIGRVQPALYNTPRRSGVAQGAPPNFLPLVATPVADEMAFSISTGTDQPPARYNISRSIGRSFLPFFGDSPTLVSSSPFSSSCVARSTRSLDHSEYQEVFGHFDGELILELPLTNPETNEGNPAHPPAKINGGLVRSPAMHNLCQYGAAAIETPPASSPPVKLESALPSPACSHTSSSTKTKPIKKVGPYNNSLAEFHARQLNIGNVQRPITPYRQQSSASRQLRRVTSAAGGIVRRRTDEEKEMEKVATAARRQRRGSLRRLLEVVAERERDESGPDISQNF